MGKLKQAGIYSVSAASGAVAGGVVANNVFPPDIQYAPGIEARVSLTFEEGAHVESILTSLDAPNVPVHTPFPGVDGINATITSLNPDVTNYDSHLYESLLSRFDASVIQPTSDIVTEHLLKGAGIGATAATVGTFLVMKYFKDKRADGQIEVEKEPKPKDINIKNRLKKISAVGLSVLATTGILKYGFEDKSNETRSDKFPLSTVLSEREPSLEGATLTGFSGKLVNTAIRGAGEYSNEVDDFWKSANVNLLSKFGEYEKLAEKYTANPNVVPILHVSDIHCNYANMSFYLKNLVKAVNAPIIVNTGDTFTNSKTMPYEDECYSDFFEGISQAAKDKNNRVKVINVAGNHDPKENITYKDDYAEVVTLDSDNPEDTVKGIDFVGMEDPTETIWEPTLPADPEELYQLVASQGEKLAEEACRVDQDSPNPEVVVAHRPQQLYETIMQGCASLALSGHTHIDSDVRRIDSQNGNDVILHTAGSASGSDVGITIYEKPQRDVSVTTQFIDTSTNTVLGFISITLHTDGTISFINNNVHSKPELSSPTDDINSFLTQYSTDKKTNTDNLLGALDSKPESNP